MAYSLLKLDLSWCRIFARDEDLKHLVNCRNLGAGEGCTLGALAGRESDFGGWWSLGSGGRLINLTEGCIHVVRMGCVDVGGEGSTLGSCILTLRSVSGGGSDGGAVALFRIWATSI